MVLRHHPLHGGAILFSALPRSRTLPGGRTDCWTDLRSSWIRGLDRLAANGEWRRVGAAGFLVSATRRPGSACLGQRSVVWSVPGDGLACRSPPGSHLSDISRSRNVALLHP